MPTIKLTRYNGYTELDRATSLVTKFYIRDNLLSYTYTTNGPGGWAQETASLLDHHGRFPGGVTDIVVQLATEDGHEVILDDRRSRPGMPDYSRLPELRIRDRVGALHPFRTHQLECIKAAVEGGNVIIRMATGGGKSGTIAGIIDAMQLPGPIGIFIHRTNLAEDLIATIKQVLGFTDEEIGLIGEGSWNPRYITVATFATVNRNMAKALPWLRSLDALMVDECHVAAARTHMEVIQACDRAFYRIGLSATPLDRMDKKSIIARALFGPVVFRIDARDLMDNGTLAEAEILFETYQHDKPRAWWTYNQMYDACIVNNAGRNKRVVARVMQYRDEGLLPCFVFVKRVPHGKKLVEMFIAEGFAAKFADGSKSVVKRQEIIRGARAGEVDVIVCTKVFQEGVDVPEAKSGFNAGGGASVIDNLQKIGRLTRKSAGKWRFPFGDIVDKGIKSLENQSRERMRSFKREKYQVTVEK